MTNAWQCSIGTAVVGTMLTIMASASRADETAAVPVEFTGRDGELAVLIHGLPVARYCYQDTEITRPYFAHVSAPCGKQVTRSHPPIEGKDIMDHATFHPGIWMTFGDISGSDFWRLAARVRHAGFTEPPHNGRGKGSFAVRNQYLSQHDLAKVVCEEECRYTMIVRPAGYLLLWDSTFTSDREFTFGDQQEMGLGVRVATPLRVGASGNLELPPGTGTILDSADRRNEREVAGNTANWCDYRGTLDGQRVGITIFCHPRNSRPSRFHARDYGLLVANPFGQQAFDKGAKNSVVVRPGETLRLRYGILIHSGPRDSQPDYAAAYQDYLRLAGK